MIKAPRQMILNHLIRQRLEYPRLAPDSLSIFRFRGMDSPPVHYPRRRIARLAALPFPPNGENIFASAKQIPIKRNLSFWCVDFGCGAECWLCNRGGLRNGLLGKRMIPNPGPVILGLGAEGL